VDQPTPAASDRPYIEGAFVLSSDVRLLAAIRRTVEGLTTALGWNESESRAITLAVEEALTNKIRHAYKGRSDGRIRFEFRTEPECLVFRVTDQGEAPDLAQICSRARESVQAGGLGTYIIRDVMDDVTYRTTADGNQLILVKHLPYTGRKEGPV
jgi:anti-sigma regulatory factor (Ser/Thr protein kinase)